MSYTPGTKLSHTGATRHATVLTNGNLIVTAGLGYGQVMTVADWLILAEGSRIYEEFIPLESPAVIGTKFRWTLNPETYRVAIMTAKGLLQVKSVTDGAGEIHPATCTCLPCGELAMTPPAPWARRPLMKTMFADEAAWRASLPDGGTVELTLPGKVASDTLYNGLSDVEKVKALLNRYKIRTSAWESGSQVDVMSSSYVTIQECREQLATITLQDEIAYPRLRHKETRHLKYAISRYNSAKLSCERNPWMAAQRPVHIQCRGPGRIRAMIGGESMILTVYGDKIAATTELRRCGAVKLYKNFAEMGNPKLSVYYRRRTIDV